MGRNRAWVLAGFALASGVGLAYVLSPRHPKLRPGSRLLLIGDSMAQGLGPHLRGIADEEGVPFRSVASQGTSIASWTRWVPSLRASLHAALEQFQPTIVLVALGTNDEYLPSATVGQEHEDLQELLDELEPYDVGWIGAPSLPKPESNGAMEMIRGALRIRRVAYFPSDALDIPRGPDRLHPTVAGYGGWAGAIWGWLR